MSTIAGAPKQSNVVWNVQILRLVAASMVLFGHLNHEVSQRPNLSAHFKPFDIIWWAGGVDIFFVISGFIMLHISFNSFGRDGAPFDFLKKRVVRLVPPYWFFTSLTLLAMILVPSQMNLHSFDAWEVISSYLFIPYPNPQGYPYPVLILGWTLNFEMLFYALFMISLFFKRGMGIALLLISLSALSLMRFLPNLHYPFLIWFDPIVLEFGFGILIALARHKGVRLHYLMGTAFAIVGFVAMLGLQAAHISSSSIPLRFLWGGLPAAIIVAGFALMHQKTPANALIKGLIIGGDASYCLYLSHPFTLSFVAMMTRWIGLTSGQIFVAIGFFVSLAVAIWLHLQFEAPAHDWLKARFATPSRKNAAKEALQSEPAI